jgi:hypothetical protein
MFTTITTDELLDEKLDNVLAALPEDDDEGAVEAEDDFDLDDDEFGIDEDDMNNFDDFDDEEFEEDFEDAEFDEFDDDDEDGEAADDLGGEDDDF